MSKHITISTPDHIQFFQQLCAAGRAGATLKHNHCPILFGPQSLLATVEVPDDYTPPTSYTLPKVSSAKVTIRHPNPVELVKKILDVCSKGAYLLPEGILPMNDGVVLLVSGELDTTSEPDVYVLNSKFDCRGNPLSPEDAALLLLEEEESEDEQGNEEATQKDNPKGEGKATQEDQTEQTEKLDNSAITSYTYSRDELKELDIDTLKAIISSMGGRGRRSKNDCIKEILKIQQAL